MAKKATIKKAEKAEADKAKAPTAAGVLFEQFNLATCPDDAVLIAGVRHKTGSEKFDATQLAWYKSQYRHGRMKGMKPGEYRIEQAVDAPAEKPKAKAKVVVKAKVPK